MALTNQCGKKDECRNRDSTIPATNEVHTVDLQRQTLFKRALNIRNGDEYQKSIRKKHGYSVERRVCNIQGCMPNRITEFGRCESFAAKSGVPVKLARNNQSSEGLNDLDDQVLRR